MICSGSLWAKKADINARDCNSETPLHVAARLGRAIVARMLLLLHAHPNIPDYGNRTPLMLSAVGPDEEREAPAYNGVLTNKALSWNTIQDVLDWSGRGEPPIRNGPEPRKVTGPGADRMRELLGQKKGKSELPQVAARSRKRTATEDEDDEEEEDEDEEEEHSSEEEKDGYFTVNDTILARSKALCELGFDDQRVIDKDGRVNRGDRIQLFTHLFQPSRTFIKEKPGDIVPLVPNDVRCRFLWKNITGPLLQMEQQGILPPRASEMLSYLLRILLGKKGPAFGVLAVYGFDSCTLPLWTHIEEILKKPTLAKRTEALLNMGFVGNKPKLAKWAGAKWNPDSYPRHPVYAPWGAFDFVDKDDKDHPPLVLLQRHPKYNPKPVGREPQAFKDNSFSIFEATMGGAKRVPSRQDQLCLANRLYLNETAGVRKQVEPRARMIGETLICPMLDEMINELATNGIATENVDRHDLLDYLGFVMEKPKDCFVYVNQPLRPFKDIWEDVEERAIKVLCREKDPIIVALGPKEEGGKIHHGTLKTKLKGVAKLIGSLKAGQGIGSNAKPESAQVKKHKEETAQTNAARNDLVTHQTAMAHQNMDELLKNPDGTIIPGDYAQFALLNDDDKRWLLRAESTRAFVELKRCTCISTCEEFSELVCSIAVGGLQDFHGRFWRATYGLFLWGRAKLLKPLMEAEIARRLLASKTGAYELKGPFLRPRSHVLGISELAVKAKAKLALHASEPPWDNKPKVAGLFVEPRPRLDFNAGKPDGGVKMPTGIALYPGFGDLLHAQVLCDDGKAMAKVFKDLTGGPKDTDAHLRRNSYKGKSRGSVIVKDNVYMSIFGQEGRTKFGVLRVINDFRQDQQKVIPLCAGIKLICSLGWTPLGYGAPIEQLCEIELMLKATVQARWLAEYMKIQPDMMPKTVHEDEGWSPLARK